ncbi:radical SAM protein [Dissulfurispira thermophila]|uniref:radical SAM protein n=1 Tax=Dissulfurispira thermophila TaxID=2715679 RepID=UPI00193D5BC4|nr:radical SAM protein [Dissulfurispira thermophila]
MRYYLSKWFVLKWLETPSVYDIKNDELYELDGDAFEFLKKCSHPEGCIGDVDTEFIDYCLSEGILTKEVVNTKRPVIAKSPVPSLRYLELQITDKCNLRCRHCYIGKPISNELSIYEIKTVLDEFEEMQGLRLLITGGEPLIHSHFDEINFLLPEYNFRKILFTNGLLLNPKILKGLNVDEIQFSVDGMENGHESIRGKGTYKVVMQKIYEAINAGITVSIATMIHARNLDEFDEMDKLFRKIGIKDWTVDVPCVSGNLELNPIFSVPPKIAGRYLNYGFSSGLHGGGEGFACGLHLMSVLANGNICKCAFYSHTPVGNINEGLRRSWKKIKPLRLENMECSDSLCGFINECRGGCRFRAGDNRKRDLYKCYAYDIIKS